MRFAAIAAAAFFALSLALPVSAGQVKSDAAYNIKLTFPDDWVVTPGEGSVLFGGLGVIEGAAAACSIAASANSKSKSMDQDAINAALKDSFGDAFWTETFAHEKNVKVDGAGAAIHRSSGMIMQYATVAHDASGAGAPKRLKLMNTVLFAPGYNFALVCGTDEKKFAAFKPAFVSIRDSFKRTAPVNSVENRFPDNAPAIAVMPVSAGQGAAALPLLRTLRGHAKGLAEGSVQ